MTDSKVERIKEMIENSVGWKYMRNAKLGGREIARELAQQIADLDKLLQPATVKRATPRFNNSLQADALDYDERNIQQPDDGLRERIAKICSLTIYIEDGTRVSWEFQTEYERSLAYDIADQILSEVSKAGYVELAEDQANPPILIRWAGDTGKQNYGKRVAEEIQQRMLKAGFRKVKVK